ncbi:threonine/serine exporter family protein [Clostridioides sp. ES-S-0108-01]|uniref:threonine/serine exporter family protein n=1 Tax=unclassified Clostridioides TaxID=2635829 RepID=UPI001D0C3E2D|nr:threonine/serine exporter family protein [Clostridioides sp. ES-S-0171-01]MCC0686535.1 threonine/serine exporter family protein [Clostridioides sp. ES-S-0056-01]MCC0713945.1 threonine/serine exporter family protein [Clostridioides sp. ES-S-0077-01]MCC0783947.1 threonine/serine exporter family protein [Clostridioides sp. ES-S-0108-01]UDN51629.1 threonine/serine exporter family protein [Clostridioides sp. ES-S-0107-01]UDN55121.1 threonine/serine exporter family protein [Clostridioides sp. ES-
MHLFIEVIAAFFTALSFGVLFNMKGKNLILAGIGGSIAWFSYKFCLNMGVTENLCFFIATVCFAIYCELCARIYMTPATTLSVCCLIMLVPGYGIYNTMYSVLTNNYIKAVEYGVSTLSCASSIALGLVFITTVFRKVNLYGVITKIKENEKYKNSINKIKQQK